MTHWPLRLLAVGVGQACAFYLFTVTIGPCACLQTDSRSFSFCLQLSRLPSCPLLRLFPLSSVFCFLPLLCCSDSFFGSFCVGAVLLAANGTVAPLADPPTVDNVQHEYRCWAVDRATQTLYLAFDNGPATDGATAGAQIAMLPMFGSCRSMSERAS